jgi:hypothetical protein
VSAILSLTLQNSLPSSVKRVVEKNCDKATANLEEADNESLIYLDALGDATCARLPAQNSFSTGRRGDRSETDKARG